MLIGVNVLYAQNSDFLGKDPNKAKKSNVGRGNYENSYIKAIEKSAAIAKRDRIMEKYREYKQTIEGREDLSLDEKQQQITELKKRTQQYLDKVNKEFNQSNSDYVTGKKTPVPAIHIVSYWREIGGEIRYYYVLKDMEFECLQLMIYYKDRLLTSDAYGIPIRVNIDEEEVIGYLFFDSTEKLDSAYFTFDYIEGKW